MLRYVANATYMQLSYDDFSQSLYTLTCDATYVALATALSRSLLHRPGMHLRQTSLLLPRRSENAPCDLIFRQQIVLSFIVPKSRGVQKHRKAKVCIALEPHQHAVEANRFRSCQTCPTRRWKSWRSWCPRRQRCQRCHTPHRCFPVCVVAV